MKSIVNQERKHSSGEQQEREAGGLTAAWKIPTFGMSDTKCRTKRANRYLAHQRNRFDKYITAREWHRASLMFTALLASSRSFQVYYFNRVVRGWYWKYSESYVNQLFEQFRRTVRYWDTNLDLKRTYIEKAGGKWRPIGAPSLTWRIIAAAMTDLLYNILYDRIGEHHYGFMPRRSLKKAWMEIRKRAKQGTEFYEYDLDAFFNRVSRREIFRIMQEYEVPQWLNRYIWYINEAIPKFKELKEEKEVKELPNYYLKTGLPQGLHWSPLLSILIKDYAFRKEGIESISYADDGLMIVKGKYEDWREDLRKKEETLKNKYGIVLSKKVKGNGEMACKKSGKIIDFLGVRWNRETDMVDTNAGWIEFENLTEKELAEGVEYKGERQPNVTKEWKVNRKSYIERTWELKDQGILGLKYGEGLIRQSSSVINQGTGVLEELKCSTVYRSGAIEKWITKGGTRALTKYNEMYYDVIGSSSKCCNMLLEAIWYRRYRANNILTKFPIKTLLFSINGESIFDLDMKGKMEMKETNQDRIVSRQIQLLNETSDDFSSVWGMDEYNQQKVAARKRSPNRLYYNEKLIPGNIVNYITYGSKLWKRDNKIWLARRKTLGKGTLHM